MSVNCSQVVCQGSVHKSVSEIHPPHTTSVSTLNCGCGGCLGTGFVLIVLLCVCVYSFWYASSVGVGECVQGVCTLVCMCVVDGGVSGDS